MTSAETKMKSYEREDYKLCKAYKPGEDIDPAVPDLREWLNNLCSTIDNEMSKGDKSKAFELKLAKSAVQVWLKKEDKDLPLYCFVHISSDYEDFDVAPVEEKMFNLVQATAKSGKLATTPIYRKYSVYKVPIPGEWKFAYVPVEDYDIDGHPIIINTDTTFIAIPSQWG